MYSFRESNAFKIRNNPTNTKPCLCDCCYLCRIIMSRKGSLLTLFRNSAAVAAAAVAEGGTASSSASVVHGLFGTL